jgi:hypothetical protein
MGKSGKVGTCEGGNVLAEFGGAPGVPEVEDHADADAAVGDVEGRVDVAAEVEIKEVHDVFVRDAVYEVADDAAAEEAEADLDRPQVQAEGAPPEKNPEQRDQCEDGEEGAFPREDAPGGAGVADVDEIEETGNDGDVLEAVVIVVGIEGDVLDDPEFRELVEGEQAGGDDPEKAVGVNALPAGAGGAVGRSVDGLRRLGGLGHRQVANAAIEAERGRSGERKVMRRQRVFTKQACKRNVMVKNIPEPGLPKRSFVRSRRVARGESRRIFCLKIRHRTGLPVAFRV